MLRMNYWRTTVLQIATKYVKQYLTEAKKNPIPPNKLFRKKQKVELDKFRRVSIHISVNSSSQAITNKPESPVFPR